VYFDGGSKASFYSILRDRWKNFSVGLSKRFKKKQVTFKKHKLRYLALVKTTCMDGTKTVALMCSTVELLR